MNDISNAQWPYPIEYDKEAEVETDVLVLGGGIAGCWAAITAANKGAKVAIVEKAATIRSGAGGAGCDHWGGAIGGNPLCPLEPEDYLEAVINESGGYTNGIATYINLMESYDTLMELEQMGAKVRDTEDEFVRCDRFNDGQKFKVDEAFQMPEGFCLSAWADIRHDIMIVSAGGDLPWMKQRGTVITGCTDWFRPVIFKVERIERGS